MLKRTLQLLLICLSFFFIRQNLSAQSCAGLHQHSAKTEALNFIPNKNQWHSNVAYKVGLGGINTLYLEENALTWHFHDPAILEILHNNQIDTDTLTWNNHAYQVNFLGASSNPRINGHGKQETYHNYFKGNDPAHWAGKVPVFHGVVYEDLYDGINMAAYSEDGHFKYDFIVGPNIDPSVIQLEYNGTNGLSIEEGNLLVETSVTQITEQQPYAYQKINGKEVAVACHYQLENNIVSFEFPNSYHPSYPLIIDPVVVAATISGAPTDNWGFTATYDNAGFIYAGGASFDTGYPTTLGAFQTEFGGGARDIAVTKYTPNGSQQVYATYIGGSQTDQPHSMVVDFNGQLCIYGVTYSTDYPVSGSAFQQNNAGDKEIVVTKLNTDGSGLIGSTYLGGSDTDGENIVAPNSNDANRGEIILDAQNNIYIVSSTLSNNFPVTPNSFQTNNNGEQDVVALKLNSDLSALFWSTYIGGSQSDTGLGIRVLDNGEVILSGIAGNQNFPVGTGGFQSTWPGGTHSAFVLKLSSNGQTILNSTYFGTEEEDYSYFVDVDEDDNVHIYGLTNGDVEITPDTYFSNPGSGQFLAGFTEDLSELIYSTVIGSPFGGIFGFDFVPVAFMVDKCNGIYFSGYQASSGLPTTSDAIQSNGDNTFYLAKLSPNAEELEFGTYYGNASHVDGGTSRFDKSGVVYQAVCSCVPGGNVMTTLPNAYSQTNSINCSIGVFKVDFEIETVTASAFIDAPTSGCVPLTVDFTYTGVNGESFFWDFGTDDTSTEQDPTYTFTESGSYTVMQIATAPNTCNVRDTFFLQIDVLDNNSTLMDTVICAEDNSIILDATTINATYEWNDGSTNPTIDANDSGIYWVDVNIGFCARRDSFIIEFYDEINSINLGDDLLLCDINSVQLDANTSDGVSYEWNDGTTDPSLVVTSSGNYAVTVTSELGCEVKDQINIQFEETPDLDLGADTILCVGDNFDLTPVTSGTATWIWQDGSTDNNYNVDTEGLYWVSANFSNGCVGTDSINITASEIGLLDFGIDIVVCDENAILIDATVTNAATYEWDDASTNASLLVTMPGDYSVTVTNEDGCETMDEVNITFFETPDITLGPDTLLCEDDNLTLSPTTSIPVGWSWQDASANSTYTVNTEGLYWVTADFLNGCMNSDSIYVSYSPSPSVVFESIDILCHGDNNGTITSITPTSITDDYLFNWSNNTTQPDLTDLTPGAYQVTITSEDDCIFETEIIINEPDSIIVFVDQEDVACFDEGNGSISITEIMGGTPPFENSLNGDTLLATNSFFNLDGGFYTLLTQDANNCTTVTEIDIYEPPQIFLSAGEDKTILLGDSIKIDGSIYPPLNQIINWTSVEYVDCPDCITPFGKPFNTAEYLVTAVDSITGCTYMDTMQIVVQKPRNVYIPNAFSPNGDGTNDSFFPNGDISARLVTNFKIFDRWGELVYEANNVNLNDPKDSWDGTFKGQNMNPGVFIYLIEIQFIDGVVKLYQGDVSIIK